jgi:hypothetical protein
MITANSIVRLKHEREAVGIVRDVVEEVAAVSFGLPNEECIWWIPLTKLEAVPFEELAGMPIVLLA